MDHGKQSFHMVAEPELYLDMTKTGRVKMIRVPGELNLAIGRSARRGTKSAGWCEVLAGEMKVIKSGESVGSKGAG